MSPLERLFVLELEFHRRLRTEVSGDIDVDDLHTSYALQSGYEGLLGAIVPVNARDIDTIRERFALAADVRDVRSARDSVMHLLGFGPFRAP